MDKNILIIIDKLKSGGAQKIATNLAIYLNKIYKYNVKIATFETTNGEKKIDAVEIIDLNIPKSYSKVRKILNVLKRTVALKKVKKKYNITHSISFLTVPNFVNCMSKYKDKIIISIRNEMSKVEKNKISTYMNKIAGKKADIIVPVSKYILEDENKNYNLNEDKMRVIYNFCDQKKIKKLSIEKIDENLDIIFKNKNIIINIGRLEEQKGQLHLIRSFSNIAHKLPDTILVIIGEGTKRKVLESEIDKLDLKDKVYLIGYEDNPIKYIKKAKIFVLSSLYEGMPNVILEAMAVGIPVISTYCNPGITEISSKNINNLKINDIVYDDYLILTPAINKDEPKKQEDLLAKAIYKLLTDETIYSKYCRASSIRIKDFSVKNIIEKWKTLIEE